MDAATPLGIALFVLGVVVAIKAATALLRLAMLVFVVVGLYLWLAG